MSSLSENNIQKINETLSLLIYNKRKYELLLLFKREYILIKFNSIKKKMILLLDYLTTLATF